MNKNKTTNLYLLSGLGADQRVFQKLDFSGYSVHFIQWIPPLENETIEHYASRLLDQIPTPKPILIGLSFGGMMAVEIAKQIENEKVILIASAKTKNEIPFYFRWAGTLRLHKILPTRLLKHSNFISNWFFGASETADKELLKAILHDTDAIFLKWAIDKVARWRNTIIPKNIVHLHGTNDKILPYRFVECDLTVKDGGHFMTLNKADELTSILRKLI